jgi:1,4-dihydroxy-2-naphthoate octaprenyltransferase
VRPPFLLLTPVCMAVGLAAAGARADDWRVWLALACGLAAHAAVNGLNEVLDFRSGLDLRTRRTPFSGGSGTLPARPQLVLPSLVLALAALALSVSGGLVLTRASGPGLLLYGGLGVALVLSYTGPVNRQPLACLLAPGLGFGPVMVAGTCFAMTGEHSPSAWAACVLPLGLVSNLLLVNQIPDVSADRAAGRRHVLIVHGTRVAAPIYLLLALAGFAAIPGAVVAGLLPAGALASLAGLVPALLVWRALGRSHDDPQRLLPWMGVNVALTLLTPLLLAWGIWGRVP